MSPVLLHFHFFIAWVDFKTEELQFSPKEPTFLPPRYTEHNEGLRIFCISLFVNFHVFPWDNQTPQVTYITFERTPFLFPYRLELFWVLSMWKGVPPLRVKVWCIDLSRNVFRRLSPTLSENKLLAARVDCSKLCESDPVHVSTPHAAQWRRTLCILSG